MSIKSDNNVYGSMTHYLEVLITVKSRIVMSYIYIELWFIYCQMTSTFLVATQDKNRQDSLGQHAQALSHVKGSHF